MRGAVTTTDMQCRSRGSLSLHPMQGGRLEYGVSGLGTDREHIRRWVRLQVAESRLAARQKWSHAPDGTPLLMEGDRRVVIVGHALAFNRTSDIIGGRFREMIRPGSFKRSLASKRDIWLLEQHGEGRKVASTRQGTLSLREDDYGLAVEITPPASDAARCVVEGIRNGSYRGLSICFTSPVDRWQTGQGHELRTITDLDLDHIAVVRKPAYPSATVNVELRGRT